MALNWVTLTWTEMNSAKRMVHQIQRETTKALNWAHSTLKETHLV